MATVNAVHSALAASSPTVAVFGTTSPATTRSSATTTETASEVP
ncbi:hypothetical protein SAMN04489731_10435 [Amycolatopsis regifaucium]|nr:hypothetical protein SAMN04489731_10435 [Amycolatopsis regifaucium]